MRWFLLVLILAASGCVVEGKAFVHSTYKTPLESIDGGLEVCLK